MMRVLFDNSTPGGVAAALSDHIVEEARSRGWDTAQSHVILSKARWRLIKNRLREIAKAVADAPPGGFAEVEIPTD